MSLRRIAGVGGAAGALALALAVSAPAVGKPAPRGSGTGSLAGRLLVARPEMGDPRFSRTVVLLVRHDASGALGFVVNRPAEEVSVASLLRRIGLEPGEARGSIRMHYGGPVAPGSVFVLHTADWRGEGTQQVAGGIALTGTPAVLRAIGAGKGPRTALLLLSYSGWAPGQLEREVKAGAWVAVPADPALVFEGEPDEKWERALARREFDL
jgi:putative transcriptional regulator